MFQIGKFYRLKYIIVVMVIIGLTGGSVFLYLRQEEKIHLVIGAGAASGESYIFAQAIKAVTEKNFPKITIEVRETHGSEENMQLLEKGMIDLGTVQADVESQSDVRVVSVLYKDYFQFIARRKSGIKTIHDMIGKRIAMPERGSGQWISFWFVANHYGLKEQDILHVAISPTEADQALLNGKIDALFRVRSPRDSSLLYVMQHGDNLVVPIDQAAALKLVQPACEQSILPKGVYLGSPLIPDQDLPAVTVNRLLVANKHTDEEAVRAITSVLFEHRLELLKFTPLAGCVSEPNWGAGTFIPIHEGALNFYDRNKPSFFVDKADFIALLLTIVLMIGSGLFGLRKRMVEKRKNVIDFYNLELTKMMKEVEESEDADFIKEKKKELMQMLNLIVQKIDKDEVHIEDFYFFAFTWEATRNVIEERLTVMRSIQ